MSLTPAQFTTVSRLVHRHSGIVLTEEKMYLIDSRLLPIARDHGLGTVAGLADALARPGGDALLTQVIDAMTTNETSFFRDLKPFERLRDEVLPTLLPHITARPLRIWSAACSSGQEVYTLAMLLCEAPAMQGRRFEITGSDLSPSMVERGKEGVYTQFEIQRGLPIQLLLKYFTQTGDKWQVKAELKQNLRFHEHNLLNPAPPGAPYDVILCRNVLIYFDPPTKTRVLETLAGQLAPHGTLILGGSETILGLTQKLTPYPGVSGFFRLT